MQSFIDKLEKTASLNRWKHQIYRYITSGDYLKNHSIFDVPYTKNEIREKLSKYYNCAHTAELRDYPGADEPILHTANYCQYPDICPVCAARAQSRALAQYAELIKTAARAHRYAYLLTATISDGPQLKERLNVLRDAWRRMRRAGQVRRKRDGDTLYLRRSRGELGKVLAGIAKLEVHRGAGSGLWHPHLHILAFCDEPLDYAAHDASGAVRFTIERGGVEKAASPLSAQWHAATRGQGINIDCRPLYGVPRFRRGMSSEERRQVATLLRAVKDGKALSPEDSIFKQSIEVLKYSTKFNSFRDGRPNYSPQDYLEILYCMAGRRRRNVYGEFRKAGELQYAEQETEAPSSIHYAIYNVNLSCYKDVIDGKNKSQLFLESEKLRAGWMARIQGRYRAAKNRILNNRELWAQCTITTGPEIELLIDNLRQRFRDIIRRYLPTLPCFSPQQIDFELTGATFAGAG